MTIETSYQPVVYSATGVGPYVFGFPFLGTDSIVVYIDDALSTISFTVTPNGAGPLFQGGSITFDSAPADGALISIERATSLTQSVDYLTYDRFPAATHELALDKLTLISQEQALGTGGGSTPGPGGPFLPLAGGQMNQGARISWPTDGSEIGEYTFGNLLGQPSFLWAPADTVSGEIGFSWGAANGKILSYNVDGRFSLAFTGRTDTFDDLVDDDVMLKRDVADMTISTLTFEHATDVTNFGVMKADYVSALLAGIAGGQALRFDNDKANIYSGYKFVTGATDGSEYEVDIAGGGVWTSRPQTASGGANYPLPDQFVTRDWVDNFGPGGVPEAPVDGNEYVRQDAGWVLNSGGTGVPEAPVDGTTYGRNNAAWVPISSGGGFDPAGDTWLLNAVQTFTAAVNFPGVHTYGNVFGTDTFQWAPQTPASQTIGYNWQVNNSVAMSLTATGGLRVSNVTINDNSCMITRGYADGRYAPISHTHTAADTTSGTFNIARIPTGTSGSTVALGNHGHAGVYAPVSTTVTTNTSQTISGAKTFSAATHIISGACSIGNGLIMNSTRIQGVGAPTAANDATTKTYVDTAVCDERLKTNIRPIYDALEALTRISTFRYNLTEEAVDMIDDSRFSHSDRLGMSAQEVAAYFPEAVSQAAWDREDGGGSKSGKHYLQLNNDEQLTTVLVAAIKELAEKVEALERAYVQ